MLGAFNLGHIPSPVIGGLLASRIGAKKTLLLSLGGIGITSFVLPTAARFHIWSYITIRFVQGLFGGMCLPGVMQLERRLENEALEGVAFS